MFQSTNFPTLYFSVLLLNVYGYNWANLKCRRDIISCSHAIRAVKNDMVDRNVFQNGSDHLKSSNQIMLFQEKISTWEFVNSFNSTTLKALVGVKVKLS